MFHSGMIYRCGYGEVTDSFNFFLVSGCHITLEYSSSCLLEFVELLARHCEVSFESCPRFFYIRKTLPDLATINKHNSMEDEVEGGAE